MEVTKEDLNNLLKPLVPNFILTSDDDWWVREHFSHKIKYACKKLGILEYSMFPWEGVYDSTIYSDLFIIEKKTFYFIAQMIYNPNTKKYATLLTFFRANNETNGLYCIMEEIEAIQDTNPTKEFIQDYFKDIMLKYFFN